VRAVSRKSKESGFEAALQELEKLVARMEAGDLPLDEALRHFERGVQLTRDCQQSLQAAQQKILLLQQTAAGTTLSEFAADSLAGLDDTAPS
jgi:exodeoxyribonuclease VII small subunit